MQCVFGFACGWQLGGGSCQPQRPHTNLLLHAKKYLFIRRVRPLSRLRQTKNSFERRKTEPLTRRASKPMGKILGGGKILPQNKEQKINLSTYVQD
jgi:hypothetical protein